MRPLQTETVAAIAFGLGMASQLSPTKRTPGLLAGMADELDARGVLRHLLAGMGTDLRNGLVRSIEHDRALARRGTRQHR